MSIKLHDTKLIGPRHATGEDREVMVKIDGIYYVRERLITTVAVISSNAPYNDHLRDALARGAVTYQIDLPSHGGRDERHLMFGQPVTIDELRDIATRNATKGT